MNLNERLAQLSNQGRFGDVQPLSLRSQREPRIVVNGPITIQGNAGGGRLVGGANVTVAGDAKHGYAICSTCPGEDQGTGGAINIPPAVYGACCFDDGSCSVTTQIACTAAMGTYQGDGTDCDPNPCGEHECSFSDSCVPDTYVRATATRSTPDEAWSELPAPDPIEDCGVGAVRAIARSSMKYLDALPLYQAIDSYGDWQFTLEDSPTGTGFVNGNIDLYLGLGFVMTVSTFSLSFGFIGDSQVVTGFSAGQPPDPLMLGDENIYRLFLTVTSSGCE